jgi:hypothetical protein
VRAAEWAHTSSAPLRAPLAARTRAARRTRGADRTRAPVEARTRAVAAVAEAVGEAVGPRLSALGPRVDLSRAAMVVQTNVGRRARVKSGGRIPPG